MSTKNTASDNAFPTSNTHLPIEAPTGPALKLTHVPHDPEASIPFDRRETPRLVDGRDGVAILANDDDGSVAIAPVSLRDTSSDGVGLISQIEPRLGQTARLMIPGAAYDGADARVVRVTPEGDAWRVGMRIRRRMAA